MNVIVVSGVDSGETTLSAFDAALARGGIHNFNLLKVSSILPIGWGVEVSDRYEASPDQYGQRLYVVMAEIRTDRVGTTIGSGLAWYQSEDGRGLFAEHSDQVDGLHKNEVQRNLEAKLEKTMRDLCSIRDWPFREDGLHCQILSTEVDDRPSSVLVAGVYGAEAF